MQAFTVCSGLQGRVTHNDTQGGILAADRRQVVASGWRMESGWKADEDEKRMRIETNWEAESGRKEDGRGWADGKRMGDGKRMAWPMRRFWIHKKIVGSVSSRLERGHTHIVSGNNVPLVLSVR